MNNMKLYATVVGDLTLLAVGLFLEMEPYLRLAGVAIGIVVGVMTIVKLFYDIRRGILDVRERKAREEQFELNLQKDVESRLK